MGVVSLLWRRRMNRGTMTQRANNPTKAAPAAMASISVCLQVILGVCARFDVNSMPAWCYAGFSRMLRLCNKPGTLDNSDARIPEGSNQTLDSTPIHQCFPLPRRLRS